MFMPDTGQGVDIPGVGNLADLYDRPFSPIDGFRAPNSYPFLRQASLDTPMSQSIVNALNTVGLKLEDFTSPMSPLLGPYKEQSQLMLIRTSINGWFFDAVFFTDHSSTLKITKHPTQTGANITDHSFVEPKTLSLEVGMSDCAYSTGSQFTLQEGRSREAWAKLVQLQESRVPLEVITPFGVYKNMLIGNLTQKDDYTTMTSLRASLTMEEIIIVDAPTTTVSAVPDKTGETSKGEVQGEPLGNGSVLSDLEDMMGL